MTLQPATRHETGAPPPSFGSSEPGCRVDALRIGDTDGLAVTLSGSLGAATLLAVLASLDVAAPAFVLLDESELKVGLIGPGDVRRIAHQWSVATNIRDAAIAVVAPNPVVYGLNRMFQFVSDAHTRLAVFWDRPAAIEWVSALLDPLD